jgi:hypothetical protein
MRTERWGSSLPDKRRDRPGGLSGPNVSLAATGSRIAQQADRRNAFVPDRPIRAPDTDIHGEPLDFDAKAWGEAIAREAQIWRHLVGRGGEPPQMGRNGHRLLTMGRRT